MVKGLKNYFPMIRTKNEILQEIRQNENLNNVFNSWREEQQKEFLDFTSGIKGVKILYDTFFKEIFNPENKPERLETLLSLLLGQKVKIKRILPGDSSRLADESSLLLMDILVELEDAMSIMRNHMSIPDWNLNYYKNMSSSHWTSSVRNYIIGA